MGASLRAQVALRERAAPPNPPAILGILAPTPLAPPALSPKGCVVQSLQRHHVLVPTLPFPSTKLGALAQPIDLGEERGSISPSRGGKLRHRGD